MTERYPGQDLLADVFEDTEDAPTPIGRRDAGGNLLRLYPNPTDPRWAVDAAFYPDGQLMAVRSVTWRALDGPQSVQGYPDATPAGFVAQRGSQDASNGNGGPA